MSELQGWIQVGIGAFGLVVAIVGVAIEAISLRHNSPPEGGDSKNHED